MLVYRGEAMTLRVKESQPVVWEMAVRTKIKNHFAFLNREQN
jgi:hypothetical protein